MLLWNPRITAIRILIHDILLINLDHDAVISIGGNSRFGGPRRGAAWDRHTTEESGMELVAASRQTRGRNDTKPTILRFLCRMREGWVTHCERSWFLPPCVWVSPSVAGGGRFHSRVSGSSSGEICREGVDSRRIIGKQLL